MIDIQVTAPFNNLKHPLIMKQVKVS